MYNLLFLLLSFLPLIYGATILVNGASSLARRLNIPDIVIGLTIVAFGTSSPELFVNIFASLENNSAIVLGNVVGSNILNILLILGVSSVIFPLSVKSNTTWIEIPLCLLSAIIVLVMANDTILDGSSISQLTRIDGIILLFFFIIFMVYNFQLMKSGSADEEIPGKQYSLPISIVLIIAGLILLFVGGQLIVKFAVQLAKELNISDRVIALTIISIGTSLPELVTSIIAARKKNVDIAIGNVVGSNIFNVFFILGISSTIVPVPLQNNSNIDLMLNIIASLLLFIFIFIGKGRKLERWEGIIFLFLYSGYLGFLLSS